MKKTISDLLNAEKDGLEGITLTSDIWGARTNHSYISLTGHYLDKNFRLRRFLFAMRYFPEDHTANNISAKITDMVHEIELSSKTVRWITIVTDGAANIQKGSKTNSDIDTRMWCVDHKIHLMVTGSLAAKDKEKKMHICPQWNELHKKMTGLVNYFHNSGKRKIDLANIAKALKTTTTKLVQNCPTRWNSDLAQLESIIALLPAMEQIVGPDGYTSGSELEKLMPDESEISKVKTIIRILKLFEAFSNSVSGDKTVTIHKVVPMLVTIKLGLEITQKLMNDPLIQEVTNYFLLEIDRRFPHCGSVQMEYTVAHFLDPQAKGAMKERLDHFDLARNTLVNTLKDLVDRDPTLQPTPPETTQNIEAADFLDAHSLIASLLDNHHTRRYGATYIHKGGKSTAKENVIKEVDKYLGDAPAEKTVDILDFWRVNAGKYPMLVGQILAIPASSASSERVFSSPGNICTVKRTNLSVSKMEQLVFMKENSKLMDEI